MGYRPFRRHEWVLQEIANDGGRALAPEITPDARDDALRDVRQLFASGDVVEQALRSDPDLRDLPLVW